MPINYSLQIQTPVATEELVGLLRNMFRNCTANKNRLQIDGNDVSVSPYTVDDQELVDYFCGVTGVSPTVCLFFGRNDRDIVRLEKDGIDISVKVLQQLSVNGFFCIDAGSIIFIFRDGSFLLNRTWEPTQNILARHPDMILSDVGAL